MKKNMKKGILILVILFTTSTYSQNFGFHFGTNLSTQTNKDKLRNNSKENDFKNIFGINIGFDYKNKISNNLYFSTGLNFIQNGFKQDTKNLTIANSAKLNYLNVPITLLMDSPKTKVGPNLKIGGYFSYLIGGEYSFVNYPFEETVNENFKKFDFGLTGGIGIKFNRFTLDIFYNLGLNNIAEDGDNDFLQTNIKNRSLNMNLIYWIK
jgi:hypothetical protein|tara:strand:- start:139 stop:765 length:627 start_codon:yes stop_codon:yes gene_type:complete